MKMEDLIYDEKEHQGKLRQILLRKSNYTKDLSITLVLNETNYKKNEYIYNEIKNLILERIKNIDDILLKTITLNINNEKNNVILGKENIILYGDGYIEDKLLGVKFHISPVSFYQVNNKMTKKLYETVVDFLDANGKEDTIYGDLIKVVAGEFLNRPTDPTRDGYRFVKWTSDKAGNEVFNFATKYLCC